MVNRPDWDILWETEQGTLYDQIPGVEYRANVVIELIRESNYHAKASVIFDFGSGTGFTLKSISKYFSHMQLVGVEQSEFAINLAKLELPDAEFIKADLLNMGEVDPSSFDHKADIAICTEVLEHIPDMKLFLANCSSFMKPNSTLILTVPAGPMGYYDHHIGHLRHFTKNMLNDVLSDFFYDIDIKFAGFPFLNVYRMLRMLRGRKMVEDAKLTGGKRGMLVTFVSWVLRGLIKHFSFSDCKYGWLIACTAKKKPDRTMLMEGL